MQRPNKQTHDLFEAFQFMTPKTQQLKKLNILAQHKSKPKQAAGFFQTTEVKALPAFGSWKQGPQGAQTTKWSGAPQKS